MTARGAAKPRPPSGIAYPVTAKASPPRIISPASAAGCMQTVMPGSRNCIVPVPSARSPAWPMSGTSSSTSTGRKAPRLPKRPSAGSHNSMPTRNRPEGLHLINVPNYDTPMPLRSSTIWSDGWPRNPPRSRANPRWPPPSDTRCPAWNACAHTSITASWSWTTTSPNAACALLPWAEERPLRRLRGWRQGRRHRLYPDRNGQTERRRSPRMGRRHPHPHPRRQDQ